MLNTNIHSPESNNQIPDIDALLRAEGIKWKVNQHTLLSGLLGIAKLSEVSRTSPAPSTSTRFPLHLVPEVIASPKFHGEEYRHVA